MTEEDGAYQDDDGVCHKCRARVKEDAYNNRYHRHWHDIDVRQVLFHHHGEYHGEEHDEGEEQKHAPFAFEVVLAEKLQVNHKAEDEDAHDECLSHKGEADFLDGFAPLFPFLPQ